jgi:hypothetical protein
LSVEGNPSAESVLRFINSEDVLVTAPRVLTPAATFLQIEGTENGQIKIDGGDISRAATPLVYMNGATATAVKLRD